MKIKAFLFAALVCACAHTVPEKNAKSDSLGSAVVAASDRSQDDRALDEGRHPAALVDFVGVRPGMKVAELMAGGGYTTELLARAVGPSGSVYAENPPVVLEKFGAGPWNARLAKPVNARVVRLDRNLDSPFPEDVTGLDAVVSNIVYHDAGWLGVDRAAMNKAVFEALAKGGVYVVIDSRAKDGTGIDAGQTLHRVDANLVKTEVLAAGFVLDAESKAWSNPEDTRDWNSAPNAAGARRGTSDRFAFKFKKP